MRGHVMTYKQRIWLQANGIIALTMFGGIWWILGLTSPYLVWLMPWSGLVAAGAGSAMLVATFRLRNKAAGLKFTDLSKDQQADANRMKRAYFRVVATELVLASVLVALCNLSGRWELAWPLIGLVVGLHFLPLARIFRVPAYYVTGGAAATVSLVGIVGVLGHPFALVGTGMGVVLWCSGLYLLWTADAGALNESRLAELS
jgi:hypothetical protein